MKRHKKAPSALPDMGVRKDVRLTGNRGGRNIASYCPVTSNLPTRMTEAAFRQRCLVHMSADDGYCPDVCLGKVLPDGLVFIKLETTEKEKDLSSNGETKGQCALCGKTKSLFMHYEK